MQLQPNDHREVPQAVRRAAGGADVRPVWRNEAGGVTYVVEAAERRFIKWAPRGSGLDLGAEAARLDWAQAFTTTPRVLASGDDPMGTWILTSAIAGESAVSPSWRSRPEAAVTAIGQGLRALHDALPVRRCPFDWSSATRLADARQRAARGLVDPAKWHSEHRHLSLENALEQLARIPPVDQLVVCHGDACAPNTLLSADGSCSGHVDLGDLGVADRWADLSVATWSTVWNYGPGWEDQLLAAYGVAPDHHRIGYYRLLWDLGP
ncbi:MAG: aminoglycoside 3'-phosphotransferase [Candidatus Dormibacteria bacterium]